jgi:hypothetical protein
MATVISESTAAKAAALAWASDVPGSASRRSPCSRVCANPVAFAAENRMLGRLVVGLCELLEQHLVQRDGRVAIGALLRAAQRRRDVQRLDLRRGRLQRRIVPQLIVIVQVFIAQRQRVDALLQEFFQVVIAARLATQMTWGS